jgi:hypothetical protein
LIAGSICGLLPYFVAKKKGFTKFALPSLAVCAISGGLLGIMLAIPVALVCTIIIMYVMKGPTEIKM